MVDREEKGIEHLGLITLKNKLEVALPHWCLLTNTESDGAL